MSCSASPTATLFGTTTSDSLSTSISQSVSSLPDSVTTIKSETCVATSTGTNNLTTCISTSTIDQVNTIPGGQTTIQVPVVATFPIVQSFPTQTLFGSCDGGQTTQTTRNSFPTSTATAAPIPKTTVSSILTVVTPPPVVVTSQASVTLPDGAVTYTTLFVTSSASPSSVYVSATVSYQQAQGGGGGSGSGHSNVLAPAIGGAVGGFFTLLTIVGLIWFILRRRKSWDDIFERDEDGPIDFSPSALVRDHGMRMSVDLGSETEPKPYQYGLVGPSNLPPFASPPGSPQNPHYMVPDSGRGYSPNHNRNRSYSSDQNQYMADNRPSYEPEYHQNMRQYSPDYIETQHGRRPSATSLLYSPLILPNTGISPEPSVASVYSQAASRPGYSREPSGSTGSRPLNNSRPSIDGSGLSRASTRNSNTMPTPMQQAQMPRGQRRLSRPDEYNVARLPTAEGARPPTAVDQGNLGRRTSSRRTGSDPSTSPRMLALANWNPGTDAIAFDAAGPSRTSAGSREQPRGHTVQPSVSSTATDVSRGGSRIPAASSGTPGRPSASGNVIIHTDGGTVREGPPATDVKQIPTEEPPAYAG